MEAREVVREPVVITPGEHPDAIVAKLVAAGIDPDEARRAAEVLGGPTPRPVIRLPRPRGFASVPARPVCGPRPVVRRAAPCGRNDPCPCRSGKKFKRCCSLVAVGGTAT